jgi:hypothetical protein
MLVATKIGAVVEPDGMRICLTPNEIAGNSAESLARLGRRSVDLYLSHAPDDSTSRAETLEAFAELIGAGESGPGHSLAAGSAVSLRPDAHEQHLSPEVLARVQRLPDVRARPSRRPCSNLPNRHPWHATNRTRRPRRHHFGTRGRAR